MAALEASPPRSARNRCLRQVKTVEDSYKADGDFLHHATAVSSSKPRIPPIPLQQKVNKSRLAPSIKDVDDATVNPCWQAMSPRSKFFRGNIEERCAAYAHAASSRRPFTGMPLHHNYKDYNPSTFTTSSNRKKAVSPRSLDAMVDGSLNNTIASLASTNSGRRSPERSPRSARHTPRFEAGKTMTLDNGELVDAPESDDYKKLCATLPSFPHARSTYGQKRDHEMDQFRKETQRLFEKDMLTPNSARDEIARFETRREKAMASPRSQPRI